MADECRGLTADDEVSCRGFRCCGVTGRYGAQIIEQQVRSGKAVRRAVIEGHRFVGWLHGGVLVGCAYHEPVPDSRARYGIPARYLRFIALDDAYQGRLDRDGRRFSDRLLGQVEADIRTAAPDTSAVLVRIAARNLRSRAFFDRHGYVRVPEPSAADPLFVATLD